MLCKARWRRLWLRKLILIVRNMWPNYMNITHFVRNQCIHLTVQFPKRNGWEYLADNASGAEYGSESSKTCLCWQFMVSLYNRQNWNKSTFRALLEVLTVFVLIERVRRSGVWVMFGLPLRVSKTLNLAKGSRASLFDHWCSRQLCMRLCAYAAFGHVYFGKLSSFLIVLCHIFTMPHE